jgi:hypothetical protein
MRSSARWGGVYSELLLLAVETCKVDRGPVSIAEDSSWVVQGVGVDRDGTRRVRGRLHADLTVFSCALDHKRASVLGRRMVGERVDS